MNQHTGDFALSSPELINFIRENFYYSANAQGTKTLFFREIKDGREAHVSILPGEFEHAVTDFAGTPVERSKVLQYVPLVSRTTYQPGEGKLVKAENASIYSANVWVEGAYKRSRKPKVPERPEFWEEYLQFFMPDVHTCRLMVF
mgnify:CR=1 FL=1